MMLFLLIVFTLTAAVWTLVVAMVNSQWEKRLGYEAPAILWVVAAVAWLSWWLG